MRFLRLFQQYILRDMRSQPIRTLLTVAGIALGVAVIVAVQLANQRSVESFSESVQMLSGSADLQISGNGFSLDEGLIRELSWVWEEGDLAPVIEGKARLEEGLSIQVYGIDLLADTAFRQYRAEDGEDLFEKITGEQFLQLLTEPRRLIVPEPLARRLELRREDRLQLLVGEERFDFEVGALLSSSGVARAFGGNVLFMDIATAQETFDQVGRIDRIDLRFPTSEQVERAMGRLSQTLPASISVQRPRDLAAQSERMLRAFRFNLTAVSYLSLIVGVILVYNTLNLAVVRRQREIAMLRTIGAERGMILWLFLLEAVSLGVAGAIAGLWLGRIMSASVDVLVSRTVESLYTGLSVEPDSAPESWEFTLLVIALGVALGILSGLWPALRATSRPPVQTLRQGFLVQSPERGYAKFAAAGLVVLLLAAIATQFPAVIDLPLWGYFSAVLAIVGFSFLTPLLAGSFLSMAERALPRRIPVVVRLSLQTIRGGLPRVVVAVLSLMIAVAMLVSVTTMVGSFRQTVVAWIDQTLLADLYVSAAGSAGPGEGNSIRAETVEVLEKIPGIEAVGRFRDRDFLFRGREVTLAGGDFEVLGKFGQLLIVDGRSSKEVAARMSSAPRIVVSEPLALKTGIRRGDQLDLPTPAGIQSFEVEAIYYDYSSDRGVIVMDRTYYSELFQDRDASSLSIYLEPGVPAVAVQERIAEALPASNLRVFENRRLKIEALRVFDQTFQVTRALQAIAVVVAVLGITNTLSALIIERRGEVSLLRFLGADRRQLHSMTLLESGLVGLLGSGLGAVLGFILSLILIFVINRQSFGWTIQLDLPLTSLAGSLLLVWLSTLIAGLYPAILASATDPLRSLRAD